MSLQSLLSKPIAAWVVRQQRRWCQNPGATQQRVLEQLIKRAQHTLFGKHHHFNKIKNHADFKRSVPIRDYEGLATYIDKIKAGGSDILWPGRPRYLAKTSGTTSGNKYIPITKDSIHNHLHAARNALLNYIYETGKADFLHKKMLFLSGSPQLDNVGGIPTGRLSGIVNHHVPAYLRHNHLPSYSTNCIEDWETKVAAIVEATLSTKMGLIAGIPPWVQMYLDKLQQRTGQSTKVTFPALSLLVHGGVNFAPYRAKLFDTIGEPIDTIETYPASEGFIAFQDSQEEEGLLLQLDSGIFFEFVPTKEYSEACPTRLTIEEVSLGVDYAVILSTNAGLWAYALGDTVRFVSRDPYRIIVTGRIKHFISAFGEHIIAEEVEKAMQYALAKQPETVLAEFTVAPQISSQTDMPSYHEWFIEFTHPPQSIASFAQDLEQTLRQLNTYYDDLVAGKVLQPLQITQLTQGTFKRYMRAENKLGGQNKVVHLANNRDLADVLVVHSVA
ncbi:MAG: GH3 auxin-responsive promoter family protein [Bacteroidota bacterium]